MSMVRVTVTTLEALGQEPGTTARRRLGYPGSVMCLVWFPSLSFGLWYLGWNVGPVHAGQAVLPLNDPQATYYETRSH